MTEVAQATVTIIPNMKGAQEKISKDLGASTESAGESSGKQFGKAMIGTLGKLAAAAEIGKLIGDSLNEGSKLQQSLGGIETLFKENADVVKGYASDAYKTAGLSANDYMESVTSFSASLIKSMDGDTAAAAELANTAMIDMADNANKMGTDMSSIQTAYQGFAKQNYTMLDNLKLGYGGTKSEMERLLRDASELSGVEYNIDNLDDVYNAIHVIQEDLGITGATAKEAATTFSGSFASMKAAAQNLMGNLAIGEDIKPSLQALGESVKTFVVGNLLPMLGNILAQVPSIIAALPGMIADFIPSVIPAIADLVVSLANGIVENIPAFIDGIGQLITAIPEAFYSIDWGGVASSLLDGLSSAIGGIWDSIVNLLEVTFGVKMPDLDTVVEDISNLWDNVQTGIADFFKSAFDIIADDDKSITEKIEALWELVQSSISECFVAVFDVLTPVAETIATRISDWWGTNVWPAIQDVCQAVFGIEPPDWEDIIGTIKEGWNSVKSGIANFFTGKFELKLPSAAGLVIKIGKLWREIWDGIAEWFKTKFGLDVPTWEEVKESIHSFWESVESGISGWFTAVFGVDPPSLDDVLASIKEFKDNVLEGIADWFVTTFDLEVPTWDDVKSGFDTFWDGIKKGIANLFTWPFDLSFPDVDDIVRDLKSWWDKVVKGVGDFFTLKWLLGDEPEEEPKFGGGGRSFDIPDDTVTIDSQAIEDALSSANLTLADVDTSSIDAAKDAVTQAVAAIEAAFENAKLAIPAVKTTSLTTAKTAVNNAVVSIKAAMKFSWSLPTLHGHLPVISVNMRNASSSDGKTSVSYPDLSVSGYKWFAKGGVFDKPTVIGIGDSRGPEAAVPLDMMWDRMEKEFDKHLGGATMTNYITIDGAQNPEEFADRLVRQLKLDLRTA